MKKHFRRVLAFALCVLTGVFCALPVLAVDAETVSSFTLTEEFEELLEDWFMTGGVTTHLITLEETEVTNSKGDYVRTLPVGYVYAITPCYKEGYNQIPPVGSEVYGYVKAESTLLFNRVQADKYTIEGANIHLRPLPSTDSDPIGMLEKGDKVFLLASDDKGWSLVLNMAGQVGYAATYYLVEM